jgi:hypothetical protein
MTEHRLFSFLHNSDDAHLAGLSPVAPDSVRRIDVLRRPPSGDCRSQRFRQGTVQRVSEDADKG